jgi:hypothetical protein
VTIPAEFYDDSIVDPSKDEPDGRHLDDQDDVTYQRWKKHR